MFKLMSNACRTVTMIIICGLAVFASPLVSYAEKPADFDGDGNSDLAVWRPSEGNWYVATRYSAQTTPVCPPCFAYFGFNGCVAQWGLPGDTPRSGDFDGDGLADMAVWRPLQKTWYIRPSSTCNSYTFTISLAAVIDSTDLPEAADLDGDGKSDIIMMRRNPPTNPLWYVRQSSNGVGAFYSGFHTQFTSPLQAPFATLSGQYEGTSPTARLVRYERYASQAAVWIKTRLAGPQTDVYAIPGSSGEPVVPLRGDWGGTAANRLDYVRYDTASSGNWTVFPNPTGNTIPQAAWGAAGDKAISGDFNGDGISDQTVWRPSTGTFFVNIPATPCPAGMSPTEPVPPFPPPQSAHPGCYQQWGASSDIPVASMVDISRNYQ